MADVFETSRVVLRCTVVRGQSSSNKATFKVMRGGTAFLTQEVALTGDNAYLTIEKLDVVKPAEANWELTYTVTCDGVDYNGSETTTVWPLKLKIKAVDDKAAAVKGVKFAVTQKGEVRFAQTRPDGTIVHFLRWPAAYTLDVVDAFWLVKWNKETERDLVAEVDDRVDPDFETPAQPKDKKQYVNLASASNGADTLGHLVTFTVFAKGPGGAGKGGKAKNKIFIEVTFGMESPPDASTFGSKRNNPVRALVGALGIQPTTAAQKKYTGYVQLPSDGGTATFQVELGLAGGDNCTVTIGGAPADCAKGPKREFINWRRLAYELMYPDFMAADLADGTDASGATAKDYPVALKASVDSRLAAVFIEYKLRSSHVFPAASAPAATRLTKTYLKQSGARANRHALGGAYGNDPHPTTFEALRSDCIQVRLCDAAYGTKVVGNQYGSDDHTPKLTAVTGTVTAASGTCYFNTRFADMGASIRVSGKQWTADVDPSAYMAEPTLEWETPTQPETAGSADAQVTVQELLQNQSYTISFNKPLIGHTSTSMSSTHTAGLEGFVQSLLQDETAMRIAGNKVRFKIISEWGNSRRTTRFNLVKSELQKHFDAYKQEIAMHPGLDDDGNPRTGPVDAGWIKATRVDQITVTLPTGGTPTAPLPGDLVGAASATNCPIDVEFSAVQHYSINGNSGGGSQIMVLKTDATACAETVCHELGHSMGMTIMAGKSAVPPGMDAAKHVDQPGGVYYIDGTPKTDGRRGIHKGGHCASGLADPSVTDYSSLKGTCIMWGAGGTGITRAAFCATCNTYLRGRKLSDIRSAWSSRTAADY